MHRRVFLTAGLLALACGGPARASDRVDQIVLALQREGYARIEVGRTWLGRTRIVATGAQGTREIVVQPSTGEVLRDVQSREDSGDGGRGRGRGGDDDDDDDSDDDSDDSEADDDGGQGRGRGRGGDDD